MRLSPVYNAMFLPTIAYACRDCGFVLDMDKRTNKCPECGSIYLLPRNLKPARRPKAVSVKLNERFLSLTLGLVFGLLTFFIWGIAALLKGGPGATKAASVAFYIGLKLSLFLAIFVGIVGFVWGEKKLAWLLGILWGTDKDFNDRLDSFACTIPLWVVYAFLAFAIVGSYGYLIVHH